MPPFNRYAPRAAAVLAAALLGGGAALGGAAALGKLGETTTVVRQVSAPRGASSPVAQERSNRLSINQIYKQSAPGVVQITSTRRLAVPPDPFFGNPFGEEQEEQALGSGFLIDKDGHVVTNYHVVEGARSVRVSFSNNESMSARIVGVDAATDVAVLKIDAQSRALKPLVLGNSNDVRVGDEVVAIGNPLGEGWSATSGIVSALGRSIQAPNQVATIDRAIQTDAALNQGNSGGPLINSKGEVIGVNAQIRTSGGSGNIGIGFAIPINTVKDVVAQLIRHGKIEHAYMGITATPVDPEIAQLFHLPARRGLLVAKVARGRGAAKAGLRAAKQEVVVSGQSWPIGGDLIVKADGRDVSSLDRLRDVIAHKKPGDTVKLKLYRGTKKITVDVKLGRQPTSPP